jgi:hypothetical protein
MKKTEVRELIYEALTPVVSAKGFRLKKSDGESWFVRSISKGSQRIGVPLYDFKPRFDFSLVMTVRLEEVESIFSQFNEAPPKYHAMANTQVYQIERFIPQKRVRFQVHSPEDVQSAMAQLIPVIEDEIIPFLDAHQDLKSVGDSMNLSKTPKGINGVIHALRPIIVARLLHRSDFDSIVVGYSRLLGRFSEREIVKFHKAIEYLKNLEPKC